MKSSRRQAVSDYLQLDLHVIFDGYEHIENHSEGEREHSEIFILGERRGERGERRGGRGEGERKEGRG